jgi:hypothetical protein
VVQDFSVPSVSWTVAEQKSQCPQWSFVVQGRPLQPFDP